MQLEEMKKVAQVGSHNVGRCIECDDLLPGGAIADRINHYLGHGYRLVHVGVEGGGSLGGESSYETVAILGK